MNNFEWDENKRQSNICKHGIDFLHLVTFFESSPVLLEDLRYDYGETRYRAYGYLQDMFIEVAFTLREQSIRIISARRANNRERKLYGNT